MLVPTVMSIDEEDRIAGPACCGGTWQLMLERVTPVRGRWHDILLLRCPTCRTGRKFVFDVTPFFEPRPGVWSNLGLSEVAVA